MKERRLRMTPDFLAMMFAGSGAWKITKNRLPEDARIVRAEVVDLGITDDGRHRQRLDVWVTSAAFRDDDPTDLPDIFYDRVIEA